MQMQRAILAALLLALLALLALLRPGEALVTGTNFANK